MIKDRDKGFCPFLLLCFRNVLSRTQTITDGASRPRWRSQDISPRQLAGEGAVHFGGLASVASLISPRYLTGGYYYKKQGTKQLQKSRYETMYEVIRTYCTSHPVISTRQVENSISEVQTTWCMLLWAYAFFDWRNEHE